MQIKAVDFDRCERLKANNDAKLRAR